MDAGLVSVIPSFGFRNRLRGYRGTTFLIALKDVDNADKLIWSNWFFKTNSTFKFFRIRPSVRSLGTI